jgi:hypothetical protein
MVSFLPHVHTDDVKGLRQLKVDHPKVKRRCVVSCERESRETDVQIEITSVAAVISALWGGKLEGSSEPSGRRSMMARPVSWLRGKAPCFREHHQVAREKRKQARGESGARIPY